MKYKIYANRIKLYNSFQIPKSRFSRELTMIRNFHPSCRLWNRSEGSIRREWAAHNFAYFLGINREKTSDADFEYEPKWYNNLLYGIVGSISLLIIK